MATLCSVRKSVLLDVKEKIENDIMIRRNTYEFVSDSSIRINRNTPDKDSKVKTTVADRKAQAFEIAKSIATTIGKRYGNAVAAYIDEGETSDPTYVKLVVNEQYVEQLYENLPEERKEEVPEPFSEEIAIDQFGDSVYLETEQSIITVPSEASTETLNLVKEAAKRLGINITTITKEDGKKMSINGFADAFSKLVGIVEGTEEKSLPEEVMHVVVALLKQKNPTLYKKFLGDITDYALYKDVLAEYGKLKQYQIDGKPDIVKIKEEAVAKLLVEMLILENELSLEKPEKLAKTKSLWNQFKEWFDTFLNKLGLDYKKALLNSFETTSATFILQDDYTGIVADNGQFFQVAPNVKADEIWNTLQERRKDTQKNEDGYMFKTRQMANRVTEVVKKKLDPFSKKEELKDTKFSDAGTAIHADVEDILGRLIDITTGFKKQNPDKTNIISQAFPDNHVFYNVLYDYMEVMINGYPEGTRFALENMVANEDKSLAGTVDFIAILPTGEIDVVDWKSLQISDFDPMGNVHEKSRYSNEQIKTYINDILKPKYGVDKIRLARAIPIQTKFNKFGKLDFIRIGDSKVEDETVDFLLPITTELEETQDDKINKLVKKLQTVYNSIAERPALNKDYRAKKEQLKSLFAAIQQIKLKKDFKEVHNQFEIMSFSATKQIEAIENIISTNKELSKEEMNKLSENLLKIKAEFHLIKDLDNDLVRTLPEETEEDKFLKTSLLASMSKIRSLVEDLDEAINNITAFYVKQETGIGGLLKPEVGQKSFFMKIRVLSRIQTRAAQALTKMIQRSQRRIEQDITDFYEKFKKVATGLTKEDVSLLLKKDKNKSVNKLIDQYRYKDFKTAFEIFLKKAEETKNLTLAVDWVKANIDVDKFKQKIEQERDKDIANVESFTYFADPERNRAEKDLKIQKIKDYADFNKEFVWLNTKNNLRYPAEKWQTEEYNKLKTNPKAFEFYTLVREINKKAVATGYLHYSQARNFLPWIEKSKMEALADGDFKAIPELLLSNLSVAVRDGQYGSQNKITGEIEDVVPKYFTSEIENFSDDIVKNFQVFAQQVINYEHKSEAEHAVKLLLEVERNKDSLEVSGGVLTGNLIANNKDNADIIADSIKNYYYGQKYTDANGLSVNVTLGKGYNSIIKAINKKLGTSIPEISESESTKQLSVVKILDSLTNAFTLKTLGIKPTTGLVNFLGTSAQAHINAGTWYTKTQHLQQETVGVRDKFVSAETELALFKLFNPSGIDEIRRELDKLSSKNVNKYNYDDVLMILMRKPEEFTRYVNFKAFLKNAIVVNGQLVNARVYYRNSPVYKNRYKNGTTKQLESGFEAEVARLIETNGLSKFVEVKNDKAIINANSESVNDYITLTKTVGARNSGSIQPGDNMQAKMNIWTNSFLVFKTWIPSLMDQRFGDFKYDANTDTYEYGRVRSFAKILVEDYKNAYSNFKNIYEGNAEGVAFLENQWQKRKEAYYNETGHELDESLKEQYFDLIRQNLKNIMTEMLAILTLFSMVIGASFIPPEDEEESNSYKLFVRSLDRLKGELMFFYNPVDFEHFVNGNLFPAFGMLTDITRLLNNFMLEAFGTVFQNEEWVDKAKPIKYTMKLIPGANASLEYLPIFLPEWSQEAGIVIKKEIAQ